MAEEEFKLDVAVSGISELVKLQGALNKIAKAGEEVKKPLSFMDKVKGGIMSANKATNEWAKSIAKVGVAAAAAAAALALNKGSQYQDSAKQAARMAGSVERGKIAMGQMDENLRRTGLSFEESRKNMNSLLSTGMDPRMAANMGLVLTYMEGIGPEGGAAAGEIMNMAKGAALSASQFENLAGGLGKSKEEMLKAIGLEQKWNGSAEQLGKITEAFNKKFGSGAKAIENMYNSGLFNGMLADAKVAGSVMDKLTNAIGRAFEKIGKNVDFDKLLEPIFKFLENEDNIKSITDAFLGLAKAIIWIADNFKAIYKVVAPIVVIFGAIVLALKLIIGVAALLGLAVSAPFLLITALIVGVIASIWYFKDEIIKGFSIIGNFISETWDKVANYFKTIDWAKVGMQVIDGLTMGLASSAINLYKKIKEIANIGLDKFKEVFGIHSPSKEMALIGKYNIMGLEQGQEKQANKLYQSTAKVGSEVLSTTASATTNNSSTSNNGNNTVYITINSNGGAQEIGTEIYKVFEELNFQLG